MNTFTKQPEIQRIALRRTLQSPNIGKHSKRKITLTLEKTLENKADNIVIYLPIGRSSFINRMTENKIKSLMISEKL